MFMSSKDGDSLFPDNSFLDFTIELPRILNFGIERCWEFALVELFLEKKSPPVDSTPPKPETPSPPSQRANDTRASSIGSGRVDNTRVLHPLLTKDDELVKPFMLLCDLAPDCYIFGRWLPALRVFREGSDVKGGGSLYLPHYVGVSKSQVNRLRFSIRNTDSSEIDDSAWPEGGKKEDYVLYITLHFTQHA